MALCFQPMASVAVPTEPIERRILLVRGHIVMLDADLAELYGVRTKALNQAVKRNPDRFPPDFTFRFTRDEKEEVVTKCDHLRRLKFSSTLTSAFTEQGVAMLSSVLRSKQAVEVNIAIMRAFVKLREMLASNEELARRLDPMEQKYDVRFKIVFDAIRELMKPPVKPRRAIGFGSAARPSAEDA